PSGIMTVTGPTRDGIAGRAASSGSSACMADLLRERNQAGERRAVAEPEVLLAAGGVLPIAVGKQVEILAAALVGVVHEVPERLPGRRGAIIVAAIAAVERGLPLRASIEIVRSADLGTEDGNIAVLDQLGDLGGVGVMPAEDAADVLQVS